MLRQDADAYVHGQYVVGERGNLSGVNSVSTRCLSDEVLSYATQFAVDEDEAS